MDVLRIGVVGYSGQTFDTNAAKRLLWRGIGRAITDHPNVKKVEIVSGLTNLGVPALAYEIAQENNWTTVGIACDLAKNYECFPVDREVIVGTQWGDESATFIDNVDVIVRVGGGKQSHQEVATLKANRGNTYEYELAAE